MAATNNDDSVVSYGESIVNFGATYAATQESIKSQGTTIVSMQNQLNAMSQYYIAFSNNQPQPTTQLSINMALPTVGMDWLNAMGTAEYFLTFEYAAALSKCYKKLVYLKKSCQTAV
jgi:hypothetical protein